jgi:hypothetical protein
MYIMAGSSHLQQIVFLIVYYRSNVFAEEAVIGRFGDVAVPKLQGGFASATGSTEPAIRVRRHFPETWLWQMLETG